MTCNEIYIRVSIDALLTYLYATNFLTATGLLVLPAGLGAFVARPSSCRAVQKLKQR